MAKLEIFGFAQSTYTRTARMICAEKGVAYVLQPLDFRADSHRALHPFLKMPALRHGDVVLFETLAIATYVDAIFDGPPLQPADPVARARMVGWISAQIDYLYPKLVGMLAESEAPTAEAVAAARGYLETFDSALRTQAYLAGGDISVADLFLAPMVAFAETTGAGAKTLHGLSGLAAWRERLWSRPSFQRTGA